MLAFYERTAIVTRVVDGDTLHLTVDLGCDVTVAMTVRLAGVNAPETSTPEGKAAKVYTEQWVATNGPRFRLRTAKVTSVCQVCDQPLTSSRSLPASASPGTHSGTRSSRSAAGTSPDDLPSGTSPGRTHHTRSQRPSALSSESNRTSSSGGGDETPHRTADTHAPESPDADPRAQQVTPVPGSRAGCQPSGGSGGEPAPIASTAGPGAPPSQADALRPSASGSGRSASRSPSSSAPCTHVTEKKEKYGRYLADLLPAVEGGSLCEALLASGHAVPYLADRV